MLFGDLIAKLTTALGVRPCPPCKRRQQALNQWHLQRLYNPGRSQYVLEVAAGRVVGVHRPT